MCVALVWIRFHAPDNCAVYFNKISTHLVNGTNAHNAHNTIRLLNNVYLYESTSEHTHTHTRSRFSFLLIETQWHSVGFVSVLLKLHVHVFTLFRPQRVYYDPVQWNLEQNPWLSHMKMDAPSNLVHNLLHRTDEHVCQRLLSNIWWHMFFLLIFLQCWS